MDIGWVRLKYLEFQKIFMIKAFDFLIYYSMSGLLAD